MKEALVDLLEVVLLGHECWISLDSGVEDENTILRGEHGNEGRGGTDHDIVIVVSDHEVRKSKDSEKLSGQDKSLGVEVSIDRWQESIDNLVEEEFLSGQRNFTESARVLLYLTNRNSGNVSSKSISEDQDSEVGVHLLPINIDSKLFSTISFVYIEFNIGS